MKFRAAIFAACLLLWATPAFQPGLFHVLQHGQGDFQGWAKGHQQRRDSTFSSAAWIYDARRLDGIPIWKESRSRTNRSRELGVVTN